MPVRENVKCTVCQKGLSRVTWNYGKQRKIENFFCDTACKGQWQREQREALGFTQAWLYDQYITQQKGASQIGKEIGRDGKRVWEWLRDYGIETRARGSDERQWIKPGDVSLFKGRKHKPETRALLSIISKEDGRLPWGKNNDPYWKGKTGSDHPSYKGGHTPERQAFYASPEWAEAVKTIWSRDNATCQRCGIHHNQEKVRGTFHIHHIVSFMVRDLRAKPENLVLLCRQCHLWVHSRMNAQMEFIVNPEALADE